MQVNIYDIEGPKLLLENFRALDLVIHEYMEKKFVYCFFLKIYSQVNVHKNFGKGYKFMHTVFLNIATNVHKSFGWL